MSVISHSRSRNGQMLQRNLLHVSSEWKLKQVGTSEMLVDVYHVTAYLKTGHHSNVTFTVFNFEKVALKSSFLILMVCSTVGKRRLRYLNLFLPEDFWSNIFM